MMNNGTFIDFEDRLLLEELPAADYSRGGAHFFGTSALKWALMTWELPAEEQSMVGNYGIGATNHSSQLQFIRHLVEHRGLLKAGGGKEHIVLAAYYSMGLDWPVEGFFGQLWRRHGIYDYDPEAGILSVDDTAAPVRAVRLARARCSGFVLGNFTRIGRWAVTALGSKLTTTESIRDPDHIRNVVRPMVEREDWEHSLETEMDALHQTIDYLAQRGVRTTVVLLPMRSAFFEFSQPVAYVERVRALCAEKGVPCSDLTALLEEDEFWDINHSNFLGLRKTHDALMELVRPHLPDHARGKPVEPDN